MGNPLWLPQRTRRNPGAYARDVVTISFPVLLVIGLAFLAGAGCGGQGASGQRMPSLADLEVLRGKVPAAKDTRLIVAEFWAVWCPPCLTSIKHMNKLHERFKEKGVVIIGVAIDYRQTREQVIQMAKAKIKYPVLWDAGSKLAEKYGVSGIPHAAVLDRDYRLLWSGHPAGLSEGRLKKFLEQVNSSRQE